MDLMPRPRGWDGIGGEATLQAGGAASFSLGRFVIIIVFSN